VSIQRSAHSSSEHGLTLLELVLSVGILSLIILLNYSLLRGIIRAKELIDDKRDGMFIANSVLTRLAKEIQLATGSRPLLPSCASLAQTNQPPSGASGGSAGSSSPPQIVLVGEPGKTGQDLPNDTLTFMAKEGGQYMPDGGTHSGIVQITYRVEPDPDQSTSSAEDRTFLLIRDETPYQRPATRACQNAVRFPITKDLVSLKFSYYDAKTKEWSDTWTENKSVRLPSMIQFSLTLKTPAGKLETYTSSVAIRGDTR
jgi:hypothetical protein